YGGSTDGYSDLYDTSGKKTQDLGAVTVKGDLIGAAKSVGTNAMDDYTPAVGDAVSFKITATIPKYPSYPAANDSVDGDGDYSDTGEVAPLIFVLEESYGTDFADPTHTVVVTGVKVGAGTTLSTSSTSDGTAALTDANYVNNAMASGDYVVYVDTTNNKLYVQLTDVTIRAHGGESLEIAYSLTMTGTTSHGTVVGSDNVTPNKATTSSAIVFTDNPYDVAITNHETTAAISTTLNSFNFSTTVKDIASLAAKPGAKFKVYKGAGTATGVTFGTGSNGVYTVTGTSATPTEVEVHTDGTLQLKGLAGDQLYRIELSAPATDYLTNNTDQVKFYVYIDAERSALNSAGSLNAAAFNFGKIDGGNPTISDTVASGTAQANIFSSGYAYGEPLSLYLLLDTDASGTSDVSSDGNTVIYNAKTSSDIPFTGGNILTYLIIAFAFGIAATVFAIGAVRRSRNKR
ncbi:hypothetical protein, partial [Bifidobacterium aquikefiri]|uniref:hypothetical protein n=1 Tax=Bifidobacterium aquikefiri TaxID=1653207 RepID=UPI0039ECE5E9